MAVGCGGAICHGEANCRGLRDFHFTSLEQTASLCIENPHSFEVSVHVIGRRIGVLGPRQRDCVVTNPGTYGVWLQNAEGEVVSGDTVRAN